MEVIRDFLSFEDPTVRLVTLGTVLLSVSAAVVGAYAYLRKRALVGDALAHSLLPGIAIAFLWWGAKDPFVLLGGAMISGWMALAAIDGIQNQTKLSSDTAIALVLSVFFGLGILLLTFIQHRGGSDQAGLDQFLFGQAASMSQRDLYAYGVVALLLLLLILTFFKELKIFCFDPDHAQTIGMPVRSLRYLLNSMTVLAIAIGVQSVGVVLMAALLITPAATARFWTYRLSYLLLLAAALGAISGFMGSFASYTAPAMPTGPWIVMVLSFLALVSIFFAPRRGIFHRLWQRRRNQQKIVSENLLKTFYHRLEEESHLASGLTKEQWLQQRYFPPQEWQMGIRRLLRKHWVLRLKGHYQLSREGRREASRVVRLHRLWEMYLSTHLALDEDHLHPGAETMEHIITPEVERQLLHELDYPEVDPHSSPIPYES